MRPTDISSALARQYARTGRRASYPEALQRQAEKLLEAGCSLSVLSYEGVPQRLEPQDVTDPLDEVRELRVHPGSGENNLALIRMDDVPSLRALRVFAPVLTREHGYQTHPFGYLWAHVVEEPETQEFEKNNHRLTVLGDGEPVTVPPTVDMDHRLVWRHSARPSRALEKPPRMEQTNLHRYCYQAVMAASLADTLDDPTSEDDTVNELLAHKGWTREERSRLWKAIERAACPRGGSSG